MNRRTFLQALSLATVAAVAPAMAEAQEVTYRGRLGLFMLDTHEVLRRYPDVKTASEDGLGLFTQSFGSDYWMLRLSCEHKSSVAFLSHKAIAGDLEKERAAWRRQVAGMCDTLRDLARHVKSVTIRPYDTVWFDTGAYCAFSNGDLGRVISVNRVTGKIEYEVLS